MLLLQPFKATFNKAKAQQAGKIIFWGKPSQDYLFNFLCGVSVQNNGVVSMAFETIANHMSAKFNKTMSIQAISQLVKKLVKAGVIEYVTIKLSGNVNSVGTFRIAPLNNLLALAGKMKETIEAKVKEKLEKTKEVATELVEVGKEAIQTAFNTFKKPQPKQGTRKNIIKSDATHLPKWAKAGYVYQQQTPSETKRLELLALLGREQ